MHLWTAPLEVRVSVDTVWEVAETKFPVFYSRDVTIIDGQIVNYNMSFVNMQGNKSLKG